MEHNLSPISMREGRVLIDGVVCFDSIKCEIKFTPEVWKGRHLGDRSSSSRWLGHEITAALTRRRSTPWAKKVVQKYLESGETPEMTIQGVMSDKHSEYYKKYGTDTVTALGCVPSGDFLLIALDTEGEVVDDAFTLNVKDVVF